MSKSKARQCSADEMRYQALCEETREWERGNYDPSNPRNEELFEMQAERIELWRKIRPTNAGKIYHLEG